VNHDGAHSKVGAKPLPPREIYHLKTEITHINIDCRRSIFAMTDVKKESILSKYKDPNMELEIRLKGESGELNKEVFESVYNSLNASPDFAGPEITYTLNLVSKNVYSGARNDDGNNIRSLVYDPAALPPPIDKPAVLLSESYYTKKFVQSTPVKDFINYSINLNKEIPSSKKFSTKADAEMRAKVRASFTDKEKKWRYDITATYQSKVNSYIREVLNKLFVPLTADTFITNLNYEYVTRFEVEIEHIGQNKADLKVDDLSVARTLFGMINPDFAEKDEMQSEIANIAKYIVDNPKIHHLFKSRFGLKKLANQPIALTLEAYSKIYPPIGYLATNKADGQRCIISINGNRMRLLFGNMLEIYHPSKPKEILFEEDVTILDSEIMIDAGGNISLYLFDVMVFRDENISRLGYEERITYLDDAVAYISSFIHGGGTKTVNNNNTLAKIEAKKIFTITTEPAMEGIFNGIVKAKYAYENDGIVLSAPGESYNSNIVYKWKPLENNTIDFLAMKVDKSALMSLSGSIELPANHTLYYLFVGINQKMRQLLGINFIQGYKSIFPTIANNIDGDFTGGGGFHQQYGEVYYPIQFSPSFDPTAFIYFCPNSLKLDLDHKIVELRRPLNKNTVILEVGKWDMIKIREDRKFEQNYFGNDMLTAESIYQNYVIPFPIEHLWKPPLGYFQKQSDEIRDMWKTRNYFQRFVVGSLITKYAMSAQWIVDLASGRGADLKRYIDSGIKNAIFVDIDRVALSELVDRKLSIAQTSRNNDRKTSGMRVYTHAHDLKDKADVIFSNIEKFGFKKGEADFVMMNFAIHYLCDKTENIRNLAVLVNTILKKGGIFVFTVMSGQSVFNAIKDIKYSESLRITENDVVKYEIKKLYKGTELTDVGQNIAVKLPFRDELVEEPICNIDHVVSVFEKKGFDLQDNSSFADMLNAFEKSKRDEFHKLSKDDIMYSELHNYVVLRKVTT
jgi:hypothetical protein